MQVNQEIDPDNCQDPSLGGGEKTSERGGNKKSMNTLKVNTGKCIGKIKPMHGVNNVPFVPCETGEGLFQKMREAGIPFSRLHDTGGEWGGSPI